MPSDSATYTSIPMTAKLLIHHAMCIHAHRTRVSGRAAAGRRTRVSTRIVSHRKRVRIRPRRRQSEWTRHEPPLSDANSWYIRTDVMDGCGAEYASSAA
jgi:hypothetical protein